MKKIYILFIIACLAKANAQTLEFTDKSAIAGINNIGSNSGIAVGDFDNDGFDDIYVSILNGSNKLYHNQGNGTFMDVTANAGVGYGDQSNCSVWGDIDNDGDLDLYVTAYNKPNTMYLNNGNGTFTDITASSGTGDDGKARSTMFADIDNDGDLDLYVANIYDQNVMYRNNGDNTFTDITIASNTTDNLIAMGSIFFDYDNDSDQDLYLTHDAYQAYILYENDGTGRFTDVSNASGLNYAGQGMGVDVGDYNNDGFFDVYITNLGYNNLFKNNGDGTFTDVAQDVGVNNIGMGWGTFFLDFNNDGLADIYVINDSFFAPNDNVLYKNTGQDTFHIVSKNTPLASFFSALGGATIDYNNDGLIDILVAILHGNGNQLFANTYSGPNGWLKVKVEGTTSNRSGIGTRVEVYADGKMQTQAVIAGRGYASANSLTQHFGIGAATVVDSLILRWQSGRVDKYYNVDANKYYLAEEDSSLTEMVPTAVATLAYDIPEIKIQTTPNPFTDEVHFNLELVEKAEVRLHIFDMQGRLVRQLTHQELQSGPHQITWNGKTDAGADLPTGSYLYHLTTDKQFSSGQVVLMRD
jgi:enediyne biosynthesis protein E4